MSQVKKSVDQPVSLSKSLPMPVLASPAPDSKCHLEPGVSSIPAQCIEAECLGPIMPVDMTVHSALAIPDSNSSLLVSDVEAGSCRLSQNFSGSDFSCSAMIAVPTADSLGLDLSRSDSLSLADSPVPRIILTNPSGASCELEHVSRRIFQVPVGHSTPSPDKLRMLDLFSGTGSVGKRFLLQGYEVVSLDIKRSEHPTICMDILRWKFKEYPPGYFDVIAAGPPCDDYSLAKNLRPRKFHHADRLVRKTVEIIRYFKPRLWWIENPRTGFLKTRNVVKDLDFIDVDYCQFSNWGYQKPTRIWCCPEIAKLPNRLCDWNFCPNLTEGPSGRKRHRERLGGSEMRYSPRQKGRMPYALVDYLMSAAQFQNIPVSMESDACSMTPVQEPDAEAAFSVPERWLQKIGSGEGGVVTLEDQELQLLIPILVQFPNGQKRLIQALVDTGAQINLVRMGLVPDELMGQPERSVRLLAANNQPIQGGDKIVQLSMAFTQVFDGCQQPDLAVFEGIFFRAAIEIDMILSFPWLRENKLGVFAHHNALAIDEPEFTLLYGWTGSNGRSRKNKKSRSTRQVNAVTTQEAVFYGTTHTPARQLQISQLEAESASCLDEIRQELWKMQLHIPLEGFDMETSPLRSDDVRCIARNLHSLSDSSVEAGNLAIHQIIQAHQGQVEEDPRVEQFRAKIHEDYDGTVLRTDVLPDPPVRGPYGYAYIPLVDKAVPTRSKPFRLHGEKYEAMCKVAQQWKDNNFIEPVPEGVPVEWCSNCFPVPKKDGSWRGVVDVRGPNSQTRRIAYPLPVIEDLLVKQGANQMFSILDLRQAFHQQPLHPDSRPITCCHTPLGVFQWRVNVMGLMNASQQFQQMMEDRLAPVRDIADPYIDDILVGTRVGPGEDLLVAHDRDLRRVFEVLEKDVLIADIKKVELFVKEVIFCGHRLGGGTRKPAPGKLRAIEKWQAPQTITELRAFLGFTNYYSTYIKDYARIVARLQDKLKVPRSEGKKGSRKKISWDADDEKAFQEIKDVLCSQLVLQRVNPDKPFILRVDASKVAVGATLEQLLDEDRIPTIEDVRLQKTVPVAFMSRKLTGSQCNWTPREQETYAIIAALQKWESWIGLQPVMVLTDHKSLESWSREVLDTPSGPLGRRSRWHQILSKFDLSVGYIPGKENTIADILSRWAYPASQAMRDVSRHGTAQDKEEVGQLLQEEMEEESKCVWLFLRDPPTARNTWVRGVTTRSGKNTVTPEVEGLGMPEDTSGAGAAGGTKPQDCIAPRVSGDSTPHDLSLGLGGSDEDSDEDLVVELTAGPSTPATPTVELANPATSTTPNFSDILTPMPKPAVTDFTKLWDLDWGPEYAKCPRWGSVYRAVKGETADWPKGVKFLQNKVYLEEVLCVPWSLQEAIVREYHTFMGHVGFQRLWKAMEIQFKFANREAALKFAKGVMRECESCQACQKPGDLHGVLEATPIPPAVMSSVALDLFDMPPVEYEGTIFNTMVVCVDRHSGWIVAVPCKKQGLTGAKVAKMMLSQQWRPFGVPSVVTSDKGSHFVSEWWQTLCALMGIRVAYSQSYFHHTNGRAEKAGQQIIDRMRKLQIDTKLTWVELLPQVLDRLHDTPGEGGLSPYQILFGRDRPLGGLPYQPPHSCEDAIDFFHRMQKVDEAVASRLNDMHAKQMARLNVSRKSSQVFQVGDIVWYLRPPDAGNKLDSRWIGPAPIVAREGEHSYVVEPKPGHRVKAPSTALKLYIPDSFAGEPIPLYFHKRTVPDPDAEPDEWIVEDILTHRRLPDGSGYEFKTKWEGSDRVTWEPVGNFFSKYCSELIKYCKKHHLDLNLTKFLSDTPTQE